jgi:hypothetical protein
MLIRNHLALAFALVCLGCASTRIGKDATAEVSPPPSALSLGSFSIVELLADFDSVSNILLTRNPLVFTDKAALSSFIAKRREQLREGMGELDLYRALTPIVVKSGCGHTGIFLTPATEAKLKADQRYLPILLRIVENRLFVLAPLQAKGLPPGSEILAINGRPASDILSAMYENVTADGANITRKAYVAGRVFNDLYTLFVDSGQSFRIEYLNAQDVNPGAVKLQGISKAELEREASEAGFPYGLPERGPAYSFAADRPGPALLAVRSFIFATVAETAEYKKFIDRSFDAVREKEAKSLVLDLRGNWGGDPEASAYLFSRLIDKSAQYFANGTPYYPALAQPIPPAPNAFVGKLVVLIDGACFSSTGHLCSLLRYLDRAIFVGEETGGSWVATDNSRDFPLPNTHMRLRSSTMAFKTAVSGMRLRRGIMPDYEVSPSIEDLIARRDTVLLKGLDLAAAGGD